MNRKGFTLIELLSVIVILAVIALISVPLILGVIDKAKKSAFKDSVLNAYNTLDYKLAELKLTEVPDEGIAVLDLPLKSKFTSGSFGKKGGKVIAVLITDGTYCAYGPMDNLQISKDCSKLLTIYASEVVYEPADENFKVTNVQEALDYLNQ